MNLSYINRIVYMVGVICVSGKYKFNLDKLTVRKSGTNYESKRINIFPSGTGNNEFDEALEIAGYSYDPLQDIFYSNLDAWQRNFGYCRLYDELAAPMGMIADSEPIYFEYNGKEWLIEFWKGQYDYVTGGEIGVYTDSARLNIPDAFSGTFYRSASNSEHLQISFQLIKNGKTLFTRDGRHWWLTGFKLGEFSEPSELTMDISITFNSIPMRKAFVSGLLNVGYSNTEFKINKKTVSLIFDTPRTPQPITRTPHTDWIIQRKNEYICKKYREITEHYDNIPDKIQALKDEAPEMYKNIIDIGKTRHLSDIFEKIKKYLGNN